MYIYYMYMYVFIFFIFILGIWVFSLHVCCCTTYMPVAHRGQKGMLDPLNLESLNSELLCECGN